MKLTTPLNELGNHMVVSPLSGAAECPLVTSEESLQQPNEQSAADIPRPVYPPYCYPALPSLLSNS